MPDNSSAPLNFAEKLQLAALRLGIAFLRLLGFRGILFMGNIFGGLAWHCLPGRRRHSLDAIMRHLEVNAAEAARIGKASFKNNFISFMEAGLVQDFRLYNNPHLLPHDKFFERLRVEERPVVAATAHLGGWELLAGILPDAKSDYPQAVVVRSQKNRAANKLIFQMRGSAGGEVVGHHNAAPVVTRILRQNGITAFLVDHNTKRSYGTFLPFLGEEASVNVGPAMLALRAKAMLYPIFLIRRPGCRYELVTHDPLDTATLEGSIAERTRSVAEFYTRAVEQMVRKYPEQWFWMHKRWRTRRLPGKENKR